MWWSSIDTGDISITPSCGAAAWECQGVGGTYTQYGNQCSNCTLSAYGPQLYSSVNLDRSQTKYSYILLKPGGANQNQYLCTGDLC